MRDLVFKNLTSEDRKRKVVCATEVTEQEGVRSTIRRHFICFVREIKHKPHLGKPGSYLYVVKERNTKERKERFFCKMKGSIHAVHNGKAYLIIFMHTLKIDLSLISLTC